MYRPCPFECLPFLHPNLIRQNVMIKREAYLSKRFKFITYGFDLQLEQYCYEKELILFKLKIYIYFY